MCQESEDKLRESVPSQPVCPRVQTQSSDGKGLHSVILPSWVLGFLKAGFPGNSLHRAGLALSSAPPCRLSAQEVWKPSPGDLSCPAAKLAAEKTESAGLLAGLKAGILNADQPWSPHCAGLPVALCVQRWRGLRCPHLQLELQAV